MAQTLTTNIVINATVGNGFSEIGNTLTVLGSQIDAISQRLIDFGKDSLKVYEDYEKSMSEAQIALSTIYGRDTKQLSDVMGKLDAQARDWASSTIFHTDDVANAITQAARAGWDYNQIMTGIPAAMQLAQAGSIDLSDSIYYITEAAKAGGIAFEDLGGFIDMWAFAANSSNGSIETFGDTMLKLGSVMQFAGSREELLSLIALMHDTGTEGSTAATLLRTAMMNILAPSGTAGKVLEQLGATDEEIRSIRQDASKLQALEILGEHGFSAFDDAGQAKPILTIFDELGTVLAEIAGGYENIDKNQTTLGVLGTIFGKRGITGALNIINMMEHATELEQQLLNGEASGYGAYAAETMMDTYYGAIETWESKVERLKQRTGETLAEQLEPVLETVGGIVEGLSEMDSGQFNALVAGMETLAFLGPGLLITGGAMRGIGSVLSLIATPAGAATFGFVAATAGIYGLMSVMDAFAEADYESKFGNLELDNSKVHIYVEGLKKDFEDANSQISTYQTLLTEAVEKYTTSSSELKSNLLTDMLTGTEIKEGTEEYAKLMGLGEDMTAAVEAGIQNNYAAIMTSITQTYGDDAENIGDPIWAQIISVISQGFEQEISNAQNASKRLRDAMTSAFDDGHLSADEVANIQSIMDEQNELIAKQQEREHYIERQRIFRKSQTLGLNAIRETWDELKTQRDAEWETLQTGFDNDYITTKQWYEEAIKNGWMIPNADGTEGEHKATEEDMNAALASLKEKQRQDELKWGADFEDFILRNGLEGITSNDLGETWGAAYTLAQSVRDNDRYLSAQASNAYDAVATPESTVQTVQYLDDLIEVLGGYDKLKEYADYYEKANDYDRAEQYRQLMTMSDIFAASGFAYPQIGLIPSQSPDSEPLPDYTDVVGALMGYNDEIDAKQAELANVQDASENYIQTPTGIDASPIYERRAEQLESEIAGLKSIVSIVTGTYSWANDFYNGLTQGNAGSEAVDKETGGGVGTDNGLPAEYDNEPDPLRWHLQPPEKGGSATEQLAEQGVTVMQVYGDTSMLDATIAAEDGQTLMQYVDGNTDELHAAIYEEDGQTLIAYVDGNTEDILQELDSLQGRTVHVNIVGQRMFAFAEGGRATEPSIFGEGDTAEWAIPEEHSERTADLLDAARAASGFTWPELLSRNGGLNANPGRAPMTLVYSPTIYAQDAEGVEDKLDADKARMEKWFAEKQMLDGVEVYA